MTIAQPGPPSPVVVPPVVARPVSGEHELDAALAVRYDVFVREQLVPPDLEIDERDGTDAEHFAAVDAAGTVVGAGRLLLEPPGFGGVPEAYGEVGHLGRLAVLPTARGLGLGIALTRAIEERAAERGLRVLYLEAQVQAIPFYERLGYVAHGEVFDDAGIDHRHMWREL